MAPVEQTAAIVPDSDNPEISLNDPTSPKSSTNIDLERCRLIPVPKFNEQGIRKIQCLSNTQLRKLYLGCSICQLKKIQQELQASELRKELIYVQ